MLGRLLAPSMFQRLLIESYFDMAISAIVNFFVVSASTPPTVTFVDDFVI